MNITLVPQELSYSYAVKQFGMAKLHFIEAAH